MYLCTKYYIMSYYRYIKSTLISFIIIFSISQNVSAQDYKTSIGARLGTYVSASFTGYISEGKSVEGIVGITREANKSDLIFGGFYRLHFGISSQVPTLSFYTGLGLYLNLIKTDDFSVVAFAPSAVIGLEYTLKHAPVNFFLDVSPYYVFGSNIESEFNTHANLGVRYVINSY